ncbi:Sensory/regulatory protein RpfC [Novipirellula aureliae]|uniref:histidine kinase n=1 Tax=Novipirellula aureliae TaxID=2527966 RepID=A0A5C6D8L0_9BACT|nr:ATP-binding protein [Novipirellula aureliae]TWU33180.1 Sensory/regulatory protein RpfC [Novipirellula aureliae]
MSKPVSPFPELFGYVAISETQMRGPIATCMVQSVRSLESFVAEWLDQSDCSSEWFHRVSLHWRSNQRDQPVGSLKQYDYFESPNRISRILEIPRGQALSESLFRGQHDLATALTTAIAIVRCLSAWHAESRIHGWLDAECIYREESGSIQLRDVSNVHEHNETDFSLLDVQHIAFLSPESSGSLARAVGPASDLYSVGVILFAMLTGRAPIEATDASDYLNQQLCMEAPRLRGLGFDVPKPLDDLVARLLIRDPRDRYQTATAVLDDLLSIATFDQHHDLESCYAIGTTDIRETITEAALVGYEQDVARTCNAIQKALSGKFAVQLIAGPDEGVRRNYFDEIELRASAKGMAVFRGGATTTANAKPLQSLETVFAAIESLCIREPEVATRLADSTLEHSATLADLLPCLAAHWPVSVSTNSPDAYGSHRVQVALEELFVALAKEPSGAAFLFDDIHNADELTRNVIRSLINRSREEPSSFLLCAISCDSVETINFGEPIDQLRLAPLSDEALQRHLQSMAGCLSEKITTAIAEVAAGNPTIASAMLRRMIDSRVIHSSPQGWVSDGKLRDALRNDDTFAGLLECQIGELSSQTSTILATAAIVGQRFEIPILANVCGRSYADVLEAVREALRRQLLWRDVQQGWFRFVNDAIHKQLSMSLDDDVRKQLHLKTAEYLIEIAPDNVHDLAYHFDAAGVAESALQYSLAGAANARQKHSLLVAEDQFSIAERWASPNDSLTQLTILEGLGEIHLLTGRYDSAEKYLREALSLATTPLDQARIQQEIGELAFKRGQFAEAACEYQQALAITGARIPKNLPAMLGCLVYQASRQTLHSFTPSRWIVRRGKMSPLVCLRMQLLSRLSRVYWFSRHRLWTLANHLRSFNEAELYNPSETLAAVYSEHGPVMSLLRWFGRANRYIERSLKIRRDRGDVWGQGQSYHYGSVVRLAECRFQDAIEASSLAVEMLRQTGDFWEMNMARYQGANALYRIGLFADAVKLAAKMHDSGCEIGDRQATGISLDVWARCSPETLSLQIVAENAAQDRPDAQSHAQSQLAHAVVLLHHRRHEESIEILKNAIVRCRQAGHLNTYISPCYAWLGTALRELAEATDCHDGRRRQQRLRDARKAIKHAIKIAKAFPADLAHCYREMAILEAIAGKSRLSANFLQRSLAAARRYAQRAEELSTLQTLLALHLRETEHLGPFSIQNQARLDELLKTLPVAPQGIAPVVGTKSNLSLADRFVTLLKSGRRITQALTASGVFVEACESAQRLLRGQTVDVVMVRRENGKHCFNAWKESSTDKQRQSRLDANVDLFQLAVKQGTAVCRSSKTLHDSASNNSITGSALAAPILFRGEFVAMILVSHSELADLFGRDELRIADFVTTLSGAALENAEGFLQLQQLNGTLEQRVLERTKAAEDRAQQLAEKNTQLHQTEEQLREAITAANAANEAKGRFLATMSHEIRTPLNGILGMTRLAQKTSANQRQKGYLDTVQESGESLLNLINDLLDFSKLEAGKMELEAIPFKPQELAGEVYRLMTASAWQKQLDLRCEIDPGIPQVLVGDPAKLRQIMINLIGNALKFTEEGFVEFKMESFPTEIQVQGSPSTILSISVQDSGMGIPENKHEKVFETFSQADSSTTRRYGGTGLGLAICRELAERMQGTIELQSTVGHGSTFTVKIPLGTVEQEGQSESDILASPLQDDQDAPQTDPHEPHGRNRQIRVLVAEDGVINQEVIVGILEMEGFEVAVAQDGEQAVKLATSEAFDICLMDVDMPILDGMDATRAIRTVGKGDHAKLPIIAMTAHCGDQIWDQCNAAGMNGYLPKPVQPGKLFETIKQFT